MGATPLPASAVRRIQENPRQTLQPGLILLTKACKYRAVQVQYADQRSVLDQRDHQLAVGGAVTGNMPREGMHILHTLGLACSRRSPAHPAPERDAYTRHLPLKRPQYQLFTARQVETCPVQVFDLAVQKGGKLRSVGNEIPLPVQ